MTIQMAQKKTKQGQASVWCNVLWYAETTENSDREPPQTERRWEPGRGMRQQARKTAASMVGFPSTVGRSVAKSTDRCDWGFCATGKASKVPAGNWCGFLAQVHTEQEVTSFWTSEFRPSHQYLEDSSCWIQVPPGCTVAGEVYVSRWQAQPLKASGNRIFNLFVNIPEDGSNQASWLYYGFCNRVSWIVVNTWRGISFSVPRTCLGGNGHLISTEKQPTWLSEKWDIEPNVLGSSDHCRLWTDGELPLTNVSTPPGPTLMARSSQLPHHSSIQLVWIF